MRMNKIILLESKPKKIKSFTISDAHVEWMEKNIPENKRSLFVDAIIGRYIKRHEATKAQERQQEQS